MKKKFGFKKVGHAGTLDPNATGVLVIGINNGTKELSKLILDNKTYIAEIQLGISTDSYDITGKIIEKKQVKKVTKENILETIKKNFLQEYYQYPPKFSAIKVNGKKLYEYARKNQEVEIKPRLVKI
ncbi:MAG: tRNA pseudouridine(55) synthase, partial [Mycoplasmoidaceae bacterium]|nr:tRNA pseudouridine(55) synthase [Mycoplasmoidaceae bacterium]